MNWPMVLSDKSRLGFGLEGLIVNWSFSTQKMGKWSAILAQHIPWVLMICGLMLVNILSIKVAELELMSINSSRFCDQWHM